MVEGGSIHCCWPSPSNWARSLEACDHFHFHSGTRKGKSLGLGREGFCFYCTLEISISSSIDLSVAWADFSAKYWSTVPAEYKSLPLESYFI